MTKPAPKNKSHLSQRKYTTIEDAAHYLAVSPRTVRRMIESGEITGYRVRQRSLRVLIDEIEHNVVRPL